MHIAVLVPADKSPDPGGGGLLTDLGDIIGDLLGGASPSPSPSTSAAGAVDPTTAPSASTTPPVTGAPAPTTPAAGRPPAGGPAVAPPAAGPPTGPAGKKQSPRPTPIVEQALPQQPGPSIAGGGPDPLTLALLLGFAAIGCVVWLRVRAARHRRKQPRLHALDGGDSGGWSDDRALGFVDGLHARSKRQHLRSVK